MKMKKIAFLVFTLFVVSSLTMGSSIFMTQAKINPVGPPEVKPNLGGTLHIVTRHDTTITNKFKAEFLASDLAQNAGITAMEFQQATTDAGWKKLLEDPSKGIDLAWGGGPALFNTMENWGLLKHVSNATLKAYIDARVNDTVAGAMMKYKDTSGDYIWIANAISSFGFTYNEDFLNDYGLDVPTTWTELASPDFYISETVKAVSMGNPPDTTSNTKIYQIITQAFGWEEGWSILTRMGANAGIYGGSVYTRDAVVNRQVGVAMTIDFYGVIANRENPSCHYIIPEGQSIVNGDPIALGINVDNQDSAEIFMQYLFSEEGQTVWMFEGLDRLPVNDDAFQTAYGQTRSDLYSLYNITLDNEGIPFDEFAATDNLQTTMYYFESTISNSHNLLRQTWGEMVTQLRDETINATYFQELVDDLGDVGMTLQESYDLNEYYITDDVEKVAELESGWRNFAQQKYRDIICKLGGPCEKTPFQIIPVLVSTIFIAAMTVLIRKKRK